MDQLGLENRLADLPLGEIRYFDAIGSTNDYAAAWAQEGAPDCSLVIADEQTAGRGRGARQWFTPPGSALAFSLILRPEIPEGGGQIMRITGLGALGVSRALRGSYQLPAEIKWPNDVLIDGLKVAGVLAEASWTGDQLSMVVLGIGINVAPDAVPPDDWDGHHERPFPATSVESVLGTPVDRLVLLQVVLTELLRWLPRLSEPKFIQAWREKLVFLGDWVQVITSEAEMFEGQIINLNGDGSLRVRLRSGELKSLQVGEIHLRLVDSSPK
ncbi:MAG: biotin--[acetyl-CoA-carboxylase] ligase [Anaerolineales bacterium]|nr:biotin--[acetyl-CoA-carboxylase] ligase [Chloroflexota bacterium]MBL7161956.1 biotin--[acetyl-CoA-carboxylase] ligase [Anaerolineales bacterium]